MGLKNAGSQVQPMMEDGLKEREEFATAYVDDALIGSKGDTTEELIANHTRHLTAVLGSPLTHRIPLSPSQNTWKRKPGAAAADSAAGGEKSETPLRYDSGRMPRRRKEKR